MLIGIGKGYPGGLELPDEVRYDAEALGDVLRDPELCGYPPGQVHLLLDAEATRDNILHALRDLVSSSRDDDTVIIFFSGHGGRRPDGPDTSGYLCPVDYVLGDAEGTGIETNELSALINAIPAARVTLILDACHAEAAAYVKSDGVHKGLLPLGFRAPALEKLSAGSGRVVLASCREDERSWTYLSKGHSLFTYFLLEGLRGKALGQDDGLVRVFDLFTYLSEQVPAHPQRGEVQRPVLQMRGENNFPLALRRGGWLKGADDDSVALPSTRTSRTTAPSIDWKQLERTLATLYPTGPRHDEIWSRAGGSVSTLALAGSGRADWHAALKTLSNGGGGATINGRSLIAAALEDFPGNAELQDFT